MKHMKLSSILLNVAAFVIVVAGLRAARVILAPTLLAAFIAIVCASPLMWMKKRHFPTWLALTIIVLLILSVGTVAGMVVGTSTKEFVGNMPVYQEQFAERVMELTGDINRPEWHLPALSLDNLLQSKTAFNFAAKAVNRFGSVMTKSILIIMIVAFMLLEAIGLPDKLAAIRGTPASPTGRLNDFFNDVKRYLALKTLISLSTGALVYCVLSILGVDYAILWGLTAFILNYIPNIGSIIAAVAPSVLAFVQLGLAEALIVVACFFFINMFIGNVIEPRIMGRNLGLSTLMVFLSLLFWGFVLGPVGMFLAVPLTITAKIALESREETQWMAVLLGPEGAPPMEQETLD